VEINNYLGRERLKNLSWLTQKASCLSWKGRGALRGKEGTLSRGDLRWGRKITKPLAEALEGEQREKRRGNA